MTLRDEILARPDCEAFVVAKDCHSIAALISVGRTTFKPTMITERGVRASLGVSAASQLIRLLKECSENPAVPDWLTTVLTAFSIPVQYHVDYAEALASAYGWLRQDAGIDIGSAATRGMLDIIAASNPSKYGASVATLKSLASVPNPVTFREVGTALYNDDGTPK